MPRGDRFVTRALLSVKPEAPALQILERIVTSLCNDATRGAALVSAALVRARLRSVPRDAEPLIAFARTHLTPVLSEEFGAPLARAAILDLEAELADLAPASSERITLDPPSPTYPETEPAIPAAPLAPSFAPRRPPSSMIRARVPVVLLPIASLRSVPIDHRAGFVLSLVDGETTVDSILDMCGMPRAQGLALLHELVELEVLGYR